MKAKLPEEIVLSNNNNKDIEYLNETAKHLFNTSSYKDVAVRTELDKKEIMVVSIVNGINRNVKFKSIDKWVRDMLLLRYSMNRKSRGEFIETMSNIFSRMGEMFNNGMQNIGNNMSGFNRKI